MMMNRTIVSRTFGLLLTGLLFLGIPSAQADEHFTERSLRGVWVASASGTLGTTPAAAVGLFTFDAAGGCTQTATLNAGGMVYQLTSIACSYTVNSDGSGSLTVTFPFPGPGPLTFTVDFVIVEVEKELHLIVSEPGSATVASGVAKRQVG
jgi:hypothetical protein